MDERVFNWLNSSVILWKKWKSYLSFIVKEFVTEMATVWAPSSKLEKF